MHSGSAKGTISLGFLFTQLGFPDAVKGRAALGTLIEEGGGS